MEVIPLKIQGEISAVGSISHRRIREAKRHLEHLMRHCGLQSVRNSYGTREAPFSYVEIKGTCGIYYANIKTSFFSWNRRGKPEFLVAIVRTQVQIYILGLGPYPRRLNDPRINQ